MCVRVRSVALSCPRHHILSGVTHVATGIASIGEKCTTHVPMTWRRSTSLDNDAAASGVMFLL